MADFKLSRFKYTWQGPWQPGRRYNPDDIVGYGAKTYVCLTSHIANGNFYDDLNFLNSDVPPAPEPRWELQSSGLSWLGEWEAGQFYKEGDVVRLSGGIYICAEPHLSRTPEEGDDIVAAFTVDLAKWILQLASSDWTSEWAVSTWYRKFDFVRYGGRVYQCNTSHLSANDLAEGLETNQSFWDLISINDAWKGAWALETKYRLNDLVKFGGVVYRCIVPHVSSGDENDGLPADQGKWESLHESVEYRGAWTEDTIYNLYDIVKYGSYLYKSNTFHRSAVGDFEAEYWDIFCPGQEYDTQWDATTVYQKGDIVRYGGNIYTAEEENINQEPSIDLVWTLLFVNSAVQGDWNEFSEYKIGDIVRRGGNVYISKQNNQNQDPDFLDDDSTTNEDYWEIVLPGMKWRGVWHEGATYSNGDMVLWISSTYKCRDKHVATAFNKPTDDPLIGMGTEPGGPNDSTLIGRYWEKVTDGFFRNRMQYPGDMKTFGDTGDGSTIGQTRLPIGVLGETLKSSSTGTVEWQPMMENAKVYYVAPHGVDLPSQGTTPQSPWKTIRYALENITGVSTLFVRTGVYDEILPLRVPSFVAVVGDELRSTVVRPANQPISQEDIDSILAGLDHCYDILPFIVREEIIGTEDENADSFGTTKYSLTEQDFSGTPATISESGVMTTLVDLLRSRISTFNSASISSTNSSTVEAGKLNARTQLTNNDDFIKAEIRAYVLDQYPNYVFHDLWDSWINRILSALKYDLLYPGNYATVEASTYFINASDYDRNRAANMFLLRDGTGLRNMTLSGLYGTLGAQSIYGTRRPSAGAYASLDPGWGPNDSTAWVGTKSPYVQNVSTFGDGCVGLKIDGDLHSGGNQTIVANDFTQILSDGIGVWANGEGRSECVSVFTYYNHIGYLCTQGGKIRGTNGNCSYGQFGAVSEGFNISETPITCSVTNRYYEADVAQVLCNNSGGLMKLFFSNAGVEYSSANYTVTGSGLNAALEGDEFRDGAVFEARINDPGDSSSAGGSGYTFNSNVAQGGDATKIQLAGSDTALPEEYRTLRLFITAGVGVGQYGYIAEFDDSGKYAYIAKESTTSVLVSNTASSGNLLTTSSTAQLAIDMPIIFTGTKFGNIQDNTIYYVKTIPGGTQFTVSTSPGGSTFGLVNGSGTMSVHVLGWEHVVPGTVIESTLDGTTNYNIEPRVTFSSPGFTSSGETLPANRQWTSIASSAERMVAVALDSNATAYSSDGQTWSAGTITATALWTKIKYVGGVFMAFASGGQAARSANGITWTAMTMPTTAEWRDVTYGEGKWVAVATGGTVAATSTDGVTWSSATLPEGAEWNAVEYGRGKFVAVALSDSSTGTAVAYSDNGTSWTATTIPQGAISLAYGNGRFVALAGGYSGADEVSVSYDGITWTEYTMPEQADWRRVVYGQGLFMACGLNQNSVAISLDGITWTSQGITVSASYCDIAVANCVQPAKFMVIAGLTTNSTIVRRIGTGVTAQARAQVVSGRISQFRIWEPGSGYTSSPVMTVTDPNNSSEVFANIRSGNGVLASPSIVDAGTGYRTTTTSITVTGDGYKDAYHLGSDIVVTNLTRIPGPGDNVSISGIDDYTYKLLTCIVLEGTAPNITAILRIAKDIDRQESPEHSTSISIRQLYSQVRLTGHDFLEIGLGNFTQTNYPDTLNPNGSVVSPENQVLERNGGRVFYTSTDEEGNFRVGELFAVEQATGTVTLNAQFFQLEGLEEIRLGGITVGGSGTVIREFSTDSLFTADSNNIVATQRAIKAFITRRVSGGGADAITGQVTAGTVRVGPDSINTTTGDELRFTVPVNFTRGVDGAMLYTPIFIAS